MERAIARAALATVMVTALLAVTAVRCPAEKVVVTPGNSQGWIAAGRDGIVSPPNGGTFPVAFGFAETGDVLPGASSYAVPFGNPTGPGAYFMFTNGGINTPGMIALGNDLLNGIPLKNITKLQYTTFTFADGSNRENHCTYPDYKWGWVSQPIALDLYVEKGGGYSNFRQLMHRPWNNVPIKVCEDGITFDFGIWETHDALTQGQWTNPNNVNVGTSGPYTWEELKTSLPKAVLRTPPVGIGYNTSPSGCSLDLRAGVPVQGQSENIGCFFPDSYFGSWWTESNNLYGLVDQLVVGWTDLEGVDHEVTFDFESKTAYVTGNKHAYSAVAGLASSLGDTRFVLVGKVLPEDRTDHTFVIDDGSGKLITVYCEYHGLDSRDVMVKVAGTLDQSTSPYPTLNCAGPDFLAILNENLAM